MNTSSSILWHRDHTFASPLARSINLGVADFGYGDNREHMFRLEDGHVSQFNCKVLHCATQRSPERFALVLWKLNTQRGYHSLINAPFEEGSGPPVVKSVELTYPLKCNADTRFLRLCSIRGSTLNGLRSWCRGMVPLMQPDVSHYAQNRHRIWLFHEVNLRTGELKPGYFTESLWNFCQSVYPGCNVGLLTWGGPES